MSNKGLSKLPDPNRERYAKVLVSRRHPAVNIRVFGEKDRRGPDNNIRVWLDETGKLHIRVEKAKRCYQFAEMIDTSHCVEIIQV